ncbi:MAG: hypothetical protein FWC09_03885 [Lachnospiraceae bacterium]|nr:hypothetical protein [Lachnospiraceae bacterium]
MKADKIIIKKLHFLLMLIWVIFFIACRTDVSTEKEKIDYFISVETAAELGLDRYFKFAKTESELKLVGSSGISDIIIKVITFDLDGIKKEEIILNDNDSVQKAVLAAEISDEKIWILSNNWNIDRGELVLDLFDNAGYHIKSTVLSNIDNLDTRNIGSDTKLIIDSHGFIYIGSDNFYGVFDESGQLIWDITDNEKYITADIIKLLDGRVIVLQFIPGGYEISPVFRVINMDELKYDEEITVDFYNDENRGDVYFANGMGGYDILRVEKYQVFGIDLKSGTNDLLAKSSSILNKFIVYANESIFTLESEETFFINNMSVVRYKKTDEPLYNNKKLLVLAVLKNNDQLKKTVNDFNESNEDYFIEIKSYFTDWATYNNALDLFNLDLISGKQADIIYLDSVMPIKSYIEKGLFVDLYEYIDNESGISRNDYLKNILELSETNGHLYTMSSSFYINTLVGKTSDVGNDMGWTWKEFDNLLSKKPDDIIPISGINHDFSREDYLKHILKTSLKDFLDIEAGVCYFETSEFHAIIKNAEKYPPHVTKPLISGLVLTNDFSSGERLLMSFDIKGFQHTYTTSLADIYFDGEITYKGFPTKDGDNGSTITFIDRFGISSMSDNKNGAFQYIKHVLANYEYTKRDSVVLGYGFPVNENVLEQYAQMIINDEGIISTFVNDEMILLRKSEEADVRKIFDLIESITRESLFDNNEIINIIIEEALDYFSGNQSVESISANIQNRVSLYLAETT